MKCPGPFLAVQLKSGSSIIAYPQHIYCNEVWIYDDGKQSREVQGMLCLSKKQHAEKYSRCLSSCPPLKRICPACDAFDNKLPSVPIETGLWSGQRHHLQK